MFPLGLVSPFYTERPREGGATPSLHEDDMLSPSTAIWRPSALISGHSLFLTLGPSTVALWSFSVRPPPSCPLPVPRMHHDTL